jgi:hypothetical protein
MSKHTRVWSWLTIGAGSIAVITSMTFIAAEGMRSGFTQDQYGGQVVLALATFAAILLHVRKGVLAKIGVGVVALFGAIIVLVLNMGRFAADRDAKAINAGELAKDRAGIVADIKRYEAELLTARTEAKTICAKYPNGKSCRGATAKVGGLVEHVDFLKEDKGTVQLVSADSEGDRVATIISWFGADKATVQDRYGVLRPLALPLFLEYTGAAFLVLGIGGLLRHRDEVDPLPAKTMPEATDIRPQLRVLTNKTLPRAMSNEEAARHWGVSEGTASKWSSQGVANGSLKRERVGRKVLVSPA